MLEMTETAAAMVRSFAEQTPEAEGKELRIFVQPGGCAGMQYGFTFDDARDGDKVVETAGLKVLVDPGSAPYLTGAKVDYVDDQRGQGFVVDNPNAAPSCSCGASSSCC